MGRERPKISAKQWVDKPDGGFENTTLMDSNVKFFEPKNAGVYRLEILPYKVPFTVPRAGVNPNAEPGSWHYERTYYIHRSVGPNELSYVCPRRTAGLPCPICEWRSNAERERDVDEDLLKDLAPKQRQLWNVFDLDNPDEGPLVWDLSFHNFGKQLKQKIRSGDEDDDYEYFADFEDGLTVRVLLEEVTFGNSKPFLQAQSIDFKKRKNPVPDSVFDAAHILDELIIIPDYSVLRRIFLQEDVSLTEERENEKKSNPSGVRERQERRKEEKEPKKPTVKELGFAKGDTVLYNGGKCMIAKIVSDEEVNLLDGDDNLLKNIEAAQLTAIVDEVEKVEKPKKQEKEAPKSEEKPVEKAAPSDDSAGDADWDDWD